MSSDKPNILENKHTFNRLPEDGSDKIEETIDEILEVAGEIAEKESKLRDLRGKANSYRKYFISLLFAGTGMLLASFLLNLINPEIQFATRLGKVVVDGEVYNMIFYTSLSVVSLASLMYQLNQNTRVELELLQVGRDLEELESKREELEEKKENFIKASKIYDEVLEEIEDVYPGYISTDEMIELCKDKKRNSVDEKPYEIVLEWFKEMKSNLEPDFFKELKTPVEEDLVEQYNQLIWIKLEESD